jgi:phage host-nuclease inhibitor protein Gam
MYGRMSRESEPSGGPSVAVNSPKIKTLKAAEAAVKRGAHLTALLGCAVAARDSDVLAAQNKHALLIAQLSSDITAVRNGLEAWAKENRTEVFGDEKSLEFAEGELKFHMGQRALALLDGWEWKTVLASMKGFWRKYLRPKVEIEKRDLLKDTNGEKPKLTAERLAKIGVQVVQEESFEVKFRAVPATLDQKAA